MLNNPRPFTPVILCSMLAAFAVVIEAYSAEWVAMLAMLLSWIFLGAAVFYFIAFFLDLIVVNIISIKRTQVMSYETELATKLAGLNKEQLQVYVALLSQGDDVEPTGDGGFLINGIEVPGEFIREMIDDTKLGYLKPEREYSEGSRQRLYYKTLVNYLIERDIVEPAIGNKSAKIKSWTKAIKSLEGA